MKRMKYIWERVSGSGDTKREIWPDVVARSGGQIWWLDAKVAIHTYRVNDMGDMGVVDEVQISTRSELLGKLSEPASTDKLESGTRLTLNQLNMQHSKL